MVIGLNIKLPHTLKLGKQDFLHNSGINVYLLCMYPNGQAKSGTVPNNNWNTAGKKNYMGREKCKLTVKILTVNPFLFSHALIRKPD